MAAAYLSRTPPAQPLRRLCLAFLVVAVGAAFGTPAAATMRLYVRGGGDGHGIGMSQYGAYGFALHGKRYRWILQHYYQGTSLSTAAQRLRVRVLVGWGSASFSGATRVGGRRVKPGVSYSVHPNADGTLAVVKPNGKKLGTFAAPLIASGAIPLSLAGVGTYHGALEFRPDGAGGIETIDVVGLEDYVRGVISAEMPSSWSSAALKVQAVAARTYAVTSDAGGSVFGLYADTRSQMYGGVGAETPSTDAAVAATRGQVVSYAGSPVITYFFSSSGGHTENVENVWPGATPEPWLRGVSDPYDSAAGDPNHRWSSELTAAGASAKLRSYLKGGLIGIEVTRRGASPRILTADVVGTRGRTAVTGIQLQNAFGLRTTYASFTTISAFPGRAQSSFASAVRPGRLLQGLAPAGFALVPLLDDLVASAVSGLHGSVYPAANGVRIAVQRRTRHGWRTVLHTRTNSGGAFDTGLPRRGDYRIVYRGLNGPAVRIR